MSVRALLIALAGAYGVFLLYTALVLGWRGVGVGPGALRAGPRARAKAEQWLAQAGLEGGGLGEFLTVMAVLFVVGGGVSKKPDSWLPYVECRTPIVPAKLRNSAGIIGAAMVASSHSPGT